MPPIKQWRLLESNTNSQCSTESFLITGVLPSCRTYFRKGAIFNLNVIVYHNSDQKNASHTFVHGSRNANSFQFLMLTILFPLQLTVLALRNYTPSCWFLDQTKVQYWNWHALHIPTNFRLKIKPYIASNRALLH